MARARNIKPGLFTNEVLVELPVFCRLLFIGLWTLADREGRLEDRPKRIKLELFPYDNEDTDAAIQALADSGFIERYEAHGFKVIQIVNFIKHQAPHGTEKDSKLPDTLGYLTVHERNKSGCSTGVKQKINVKLTENNVNPPLGNIELTVSKRPDSPNPEVNQQPSSLIQPVEAQPSAGSDDLRLVPDVPTQPGQWLIWFNQTQGTDYDPGSRFTRGNVWQTFTRWCGASVCTAEVSAGIARALAEAKGPISNLPSYVERLLLNDQQARASPTHMSHADKSKLAAARAIFGTEIEGNQNEQGSRIIDVTPTFAPLLGG